MTGYSTVVFDLDGTLLDTLEDLHLAINHTLTWAGLPEQTLADTRAYVGNGIRRLIENSVPKGTSADMIDTMQAEFDSFYAVHCDDHTHPYLGIPELLGRLRAEGRRISVVSNKTDYAVASLVAKHFPDVFDVAVGVREGVAKKPARDMVDLALSLMGEEAARDAAEGRAAYVGDSEVDVATSANAGLPCLAVCWGFRSTKQLADAGATVIARDARELMSLISGELG